MDRLAPGAIGQIPPLSSKADDAGDVDALRAAGLVRTVAAVLDEGEGRGGNAQIPLLGSRDDAGPVPDELAADGFKVV